MTWTWVAVGCIVLGVVSMGMTGCVWLALPEKLGLVRAITGDIAWPAALGMAVLWPLLLPIAVLVKHYLIRISGSVLRFGCWYHLAFHLLQMSPLVL